MVPTRIVCCLVLVLVASFRVSSNPDFVVATEPTQAFDRYGNIRWEDEKARLDNFAIHLWDDSNYLGYIWVFQAPDMCAGEAEARAIRGQNYLVNYRHVSWNRVVWMVGHRREFETVFWVITRDKASSPPIPDDDPTAKRSVAVKGCAKRLAQIKRSRFN